MVIIANRPSMAADDNETLRKITAIGAEIVSGRIIPYLGPGHLSASAAAPAVPVTETALALELAKRVPVGARIKGNVWATAQFIEQRRHRKTLVAMMTEIFKPAIEPGPLQKWFARQKLPLIVDTWYDASVATAFRNAGRSDFGEVQGVTRALENRDVWVKYYAADGREADPSVSATWRTIIYKPHGSVAPASNFLVADSDYVEVLSEIDIQTPIPALIQELRRGRGFLFLGCRFDDQMLRTYARQIMKRSGGQSYAIVSGEPTRMELKFFAEAGIEPLFAPIANAITALTSV